MDSRRRPLAARHGGDARGGSESARRGRVGRSQTAGTTRQGRAGVGDAGLRGSRQAFVPGRLADAGPLGAGALDSNGSRTTSPGSRSTVRWCPTAPRTIPGIPAGDSDEGREAVTHSALGSRHDDGDRRRAARADPAERVTIVSPADGEYVTGRIVIRARVEPRRRRERGVLRGWPPGVRRAPDAVRVRNGMPDPLVEQHQIRVAATFKNGARLVHNVRTKDLAYAQDEPTSTSSR